ncbi:MAG: exosome complex RNA-binding protein Csl4 [Aigarchaeota archaeon]|nr:exosome complex RNA-binding protein Csl4 [Aigarchaeota archaeon]MDW8092285.1 exosome complex RNA-binding protein Csl4 [Nitrososphaerota archaeon]
MKRDLAFPGKRLCVIEEFLPGRYAFISQGGEVVSSVIGYPVYDTKQHVVSVSSMRPSLKPVVGDVVLCEVREVQDRVVLCDIIAKEGGEVKYRWNGAIVTTPRSGKASLPAFTIGDLVVAVVKSESFGMYELTIDEKGLGVVLAFCDYCGRNLIYRRGSLVCNKCRVAFRRKTVSYYGNREAILSRFGLQLS